MSDTPNLASAGGKIMLVGLGPGSHDHLTARARAAIAGPVVRGAGEAMALVGLLAVAMLLA